MFAQKRLNNRGFTVIETLIVLAIAGLILLIVLLAIPALQRSSRNNQRRQDVQAVLEAVSHYALNNSGNFLDCGHGSAPSCYGAGNLLNASKLTFYTDNGQVQVQPLAANQTAPAPSDKNKVYVYNHQKCLPAGNGSTPRGAGYSDVVALYALETGSGTAWRCQQL